MIRLAIGATVSLLVLLTAWAAASTLEVDGGAAGYEVVHTPPPPEQVQGVSADPQGELTAVGRFSVAIQQAVEVTWEKNDPDEGVTEYRVYRTQDYSGDFSRIGTTAGPAFIDHAVEDGETYVYYVTAVNEVGESIPSDEASAQLPVDCEALEPDSEAYADAVAGGDCPELEPTPTTATEPGEDGLAAETLGAEATAESTATPEPTPTGTPFPTRTPSPVPTATSPATATPLPTETPQPTQTPLPTQTPDPTPTEEPTVAPTATEDPLPTAPPPP